MPLTKLEIILIAEQYEHKATFREEQRTAYERASRKGWLKDITKHMQSGHKGPETKNTKTACRAAAKKYLTRSDFREQDHSLYVTAAKHGWLDDICAHMVSGHKLRWQNQQTMQSEA